MDQIKRWVWSALEPVEGFSHPQPIVREYALPWVAPYLMHDYELVWCTFPSHSHLEAAQADPRLTVLPSLHSGDPIPAEIAQALAEFGVNENMTTFGMLLKLSEIDPLYLPEN